MKKSNKLFNAFRIWILIIIVSSISSGVLAYKYYLGIEKAYKVIAHFPLVVKFIDDDIGYVLEDEECYAVLNEETLEHKYYNFSGEEVKKPQGEREETIDENDGQTLEVIEGYPYLKDKNGKILYKGELAEKVSLIEKNLLLKSEYKKSILFNVRTGEERVLPIDKVSRLDSVNYGKAKYVAQKSAYYENEKQFEIFDENYKVIPSDEFKSFDGFYENMGLTDKGYIDKRFNLIFKKPIGSTINPFSEGLAIIDYRDYVECIDKNFKKVFSVKGVLGDDDSLNAYDHSFKNGYLVLESTDRKFGIVDKKGEWVIKPCLDDIDIDGKFAIVKIDGKSGVICLRN